MTFSSFFSHLPHNKNIYFRVEKDLGPYQTPRMVSFDGLETEKLCTMDKLRYRFDPKNKDWAGRKEKSAWYIYWEDGAGKNEYKVEVKYRSCPAKGTFYKVRRSNR